MRPSTGAMMNFLIRLCLRQIVGVALGVILLAVIAAFQGGVPARIAYLREMRRERAAPVIDRHPRPIDVNPNILQ